MVEKMVSLKNEDGYQTPMKSKLQTAIDLSPCNIVNAKSEDSPITIIDPFEDIKLPQKIHGYKDSNPVKNELRVLLSNEKVKVQNFKFKYILGSTLSSTSSFLYFSYF